VNFRRTRIVGIGNVLAGDDGLGIHAVETIRKLVSEGSWPHLETVALTLPGPELFDGLCDGDLLILLDACSSGAVAGTVHCFGADEIGCSGLRHLSTHGLGLADWISLAQAAGEETPEVRVYSIEMQHCRMGEPLSAAVAASMPELLKLIWSCIDSYRTGECYA
jgi:hydrogenase maturation protease